MRISEQGDTSNRSTCQHEIIQLSTSISNFAFLSLDLCSSSTTSMVWLRLQAQAHRQDCLAQEPAQEPAQELIQVQQPVRERDRV